MLTKHICSFSYPKYLISATEQQGRHTLKKYKDYYIFTAPVWTSQVQDFNYCPSVHAQYFMQGHALCTESDREMSLPTMRGLAGADASGNRQAWHLNNSKSHFFSHDKCCIPKFNQSCFIFPNQKKKKTVKRVGSNFGFVSSTLSWWINVILSTVQN